MKGRRIYTRVFPYLIIFEKLPWVENYIAEDLNWLFPDGISGRFYVFIYERCLCLSLHSVRGKYYHNQLCISPCHPLLSSSSRLAFCVWKTSSAATNSGWMAVGGQAKSKSHSGIKAALFRKTVIIVNLVNNWATPSRARITLTNTHSSSHFGLTSPLSNLCKWLSDISLHWNSRWVR